MGLLYIPILFYFKWFVKIEGNVKCSVVIIFYIVLERKYLILSKFIDNKTFRLKVEQDL